MPSLSGFMLLLAAEVAPAADASAALTVGTSFLAVQGCCGPGFESNVILPDTTGDVGPTQILVATNGRIKVFDRAGTLGALDMTLEVFFRSVGGFTHGAAYPRIRYDRLAQRWFVAAIDFAGCPNNILLAVSSGPVITDASSFTFFSFVGQAGRFTEFPTLGVDRHALYIGGSLFDLSAFGCPLPSDPPQTTVWVINKADLLGGTLTVTAFRDLIDHTAETGAWSPQGADNDDPAATTGYFVGVDGFQYSRLALYRVNDPGGAPSLTGPLEIPIPTTIGPMPQPQPAGPPLSAIDDRLAGASVRRNRITGARTLWTAHNIEVDATGVANPSGNRNASRWYEIRRLERTPTVVQAGTLFDSAAANPFGYWIPSLAMSGQGHVALAANRASANPAGGHAGIAAATRFRTDPPGTIQAPALVQGSTFVFDHGAAGPQRWGDYSRTVVDPNDDQTMWTFQEYAMATNTWGVRVIQLLAPPPATPKIADPPVILPEQPSVDVIITGVSTGGSEFFDPGPDTGGPGFANHIAASLSGGVVVNSVRFDTPTQVTLNVSTVGAPVGPKDLTVVNPDGQAATGPGVLAVQTDLIFEDGFET
jgi:hypothetical protein